MFSEFSAKVVNYFNSIVDLTNISSNYFNSISEFQR